MVSSMQNGFSSYVYHIQRLDFSFTGLQRGGAFQESNFETPGVAERAEISLREMMRDGQQFKPTDGVVNKSLQRSSAVDGPLVSKLLGDHGGWTNRQEQGPLLQASELSEGLSDVRELSQGEESIHTDLSRTLRNEDKNGDISEGIVA